jgi:hypothetical protein
MNGVSLLLLFASLGATTTVEVGANGQQVYTIRIESLLINELRAGQAIPILVAPRDRRIRHFKIAVTPEGNPRASALSRASDFNIQGGYDYEPTQLENGEIEYVVQISPERLESLVAGKPIEGDIATEIVDVHRYLIFVGIGQLPSQQQAASQVVAPPPSLLTGGREIRANSDNTSRGSVPARNTFPAATQPSTQRGFQTNDPLTQFNTRTNEPRTNFRNQPDQSTVNPPPFATAGPANTSNAVLPRSTGIPGLSDRNTYPTQPTYTATPPTYNNQYQPPGYADPNPGYAQPNPGTYPTQGYAGNPTVGYQQPAATVTARTDVPQPGLSPQPPTAAWNQPTAAAQPSAATAPVAATVQPPVATISSTQDKADAERPWTPLILTTLALFASLGANAYLGWLAWSFFWRFRDAITESARTRAQHSLSRQAA